MTQSDALSGYCAGLNSSIYTLDNVPKANGSSLRCLVNNCPPPEEPTSGTHVATDASITWNWNPVAGCLGYSLSTTGHIGDETDLGNVTTYTETGLTCNTVYTRYLRAYNSCEYSTELMITMATPVCLACGVTSITINHLAAGGVAPVNKSTTYGLVAMVPGEPLKCWITKNLGASHQPYANYDEDEAAAGWYWQFNRKQGYQYTTSRTPNTAWISIISENSDWLPANDPCRLELGTDWRMPTNAEWTNVDLAGNWNNQVGPWDSPLRLHRSGCISGGVLYSIGSEGYYWSATQGSVTTGGYLLDSYLNAQVFNLDKSLGFSVRCLK
jgi:hypothetical protein